MSDECTCDSEPFEPHEITCPLWDGSECDHDYEACDFHPDRGEHCGYCGGDPDYHYRTSDASKAAAQ